MIDKQAVKNNFSRCAPYYDQYANVQNICALELISRVQQNGFSDVLEIGCGTGNYTQLLCSKFPQAKIKAVDLSAAMVKIARGKIKPAQVDFLVADAEELKLKPGFGLVSSNVSFQWFNSLSSALGRYKNLLGQGGVIYFSLFGPATFFELNECLTRLSARIEPSVAAAFWAKEKIEIVLQELFREAAVERKIYKEKYDSILQLFNKIKHTGVSGRNRHDGTFWTAGMINQLERIYKERFQDIVATYEIFFCKGVK